MESPLMILPCLSAQLELYADHVVFRPKGVWASIARMVVQIIPLREIEQLRLFRSGPRMTGVLEIKRQEGARPRSLYVMYADAYAREAAVFYETLDDLRTRKDVLGVIKTLKPT